MNWTDFFSKELSIGGSNPTIVSLIPQY
jgi:hypothetical protein